MGPLSGISSEEHFKLLRAWNIAVKMVWDLPYATHTSFLESLSPVPHLESVLLGRYIGFLQNLSQSEHPILTVIFNSTWCDLSSLTGQNVKFLLGKFQKQDLAALIAGKQSLIKSRIHSLKEEDAWKINLIEEISLIKKEHLETSFDEEDLEEILKFICTAYTGLGLGYEYSIFTHKTAPPFNQPSITNSKATKQYYMC